MICKNNLWFNIRAKQFFSQERCKPVNTLRQRGMSLQSEETHLLILDQTEKAHICLRREINLQKDSRGYRAIPIKPYSCHKALSTMGLFVVVSCSDTTNFANHICHSQDNN